MKRCNKDANLKTWNQLLLPKIERMLQYILFGHLLIYAAMHLQTKQPHKKYGDTKQCMVEPINSEMSM
jgi:hypothetical protein